MEVSDAEEESESSTTTRNINNIKAILRDQWGALKPKYVEKLKETPIFMVVSWTGTDKCFTEEECKARVREIQEDNMNKEGLPDIKYNFLIGHDRNLYEGRGWNVSTNVSEGEGKAFSNMDGKSIYVAFIGPKDDLPFPHLLVTLAGMCHNGVTEGHMSRDVRFVKVHKGKAETYDGTFQESEENIIKKGYDDDDEF